MIVAAAAEGLIVDGGGVRLGRRLGGDDPVEEVPTPVVLPPPPVATAGRDAGPVPDLEEEAQDPARRMVRVVSEPPGAQVLVAGALVGNTPVEIPVPDEGRERTVEVRQRGYETQTVLITTSSPDEISVALEQEERVARTPGVRRDPTVRTEMASNEATTTASMEAPTMMRTSFTNEVVDPWAE